MSDINIHQLPNGIIVCHRQVNNTKIAHCGFTFDIGSRDEKEHQLGLAHFWEHMAFKGTNKRKAYHVINRLETVGGDLNAYTTKEKVYLYASVLDQHFDRACELLTDISFNSIFPEKEIEKEKGVIIEEMAMYEDSPEDAIMDEFDSLVYSDHALGKNILGTRESVLGFKQNDFISFLDENMGQEQIIFSSVSSLPFSKVLKSVEKHLSAINLKKIIRKRQKPSVQEVQNVIVSKPIQQSHVVLGTKAPQIMSADRIPFFMVSYLLGGPIMGSRFNLNLREKHGLVYNVDSSFNTMTDNGNFSVYFGTEKQKVNKAKSLIFKEIEKLQQKELGLLQLAKLKNQLCAGLAMAEESNSSFMQMMGKSLLDVGKIESMTDVFEKIESVTASQFRDVANTYLAKDSFSSLTYLSE